MDYKIFTRMALFFLTILTGISLSAQAQVAIILNDLTVEGRKTSAGWIFEGEHDTILAFTKKDYSRVMKKLAELREEIRHLEELARVSENLTTTFEKYGEKADTHIGVQERMIRKTDSLYRGYQRLSEDLEDRCMPREFSLILGTGLYNSGNNRWQPLLNVGLEYQDVGGSYHFGKDFHGLSFQYRLLSF